MDSFNLENQNSDINSKIVVAFELISQVFRINLWNIQKEYKISPIQTQMMIFLNSHSYELCTVTQLSKEFNITKATVSDSIRVLIKKDYLYKKIEKNDSRIFYLFLTDYGKDLVAKLDGFSDSLHNSLLNLKVKDKKNMFDNFVTIISNLQDSGSISERRMCSKCQFYRFISDQTFHCSFMEKKLRNINFRLDCSEFKAKV